MKLSWVGPAVAALLACGLITQSRPAFDTVSVKPAQFSQRQPRGFGLRNITPGGLDASAATLADLFVFAYQVDNLERRVTGLRDWMDSARWSVEARTAAGTPDLTQNLALARQMTQRLLADRFGLQVKEDMRTLPVYELRLAGERPKQLAPASDSSQPHMLYGDGPNMLAEAITMTELANSFSGSLDRMVIDDTGLTGTYQFKVTTAAIPAGTRGPQWREMQAREVIRALGLKLVSAQAPVQCYTILHAAPPQPN